MRWLFDHYQIAYTEYPHAPIFNLIAQRFAGEKGKSFPMIIRDGQVIIGLNQLFPILEAEAPADLKLLPTDDPQLFDAIMAAQQDVRINVGNDVVNWCYWHYLQHKSIVWPSLATHTPWFERAALWLGFPIFRRLLYKALKIDENSANTAIKEIHANWDFYDDMLSNGNEYMYGNKLTIFDLAISAMLAPMILAHGYHGMLPNQSVCPTYMQEVFIKLRARPTGRYIQNIYDKHRAATLLATKK